MLISLVFAKIVIEICKQKYIEWGCEAISSLYLIVLSICLHFNSIKEYSFTLWLFAFIFQIVFNSKDLHSIEIMWIHFCDWTLNFIIAVLCVQRKEFSSSSDEKKRINEGNVLKTLDYLQTGVMLYNSQNGYLFKNKYLENKLNNVWEEMDLNYIDEVLDLAIWKTDSTLSLGEYIRNNYEHYVKWMRNENKEQWF